MKDVSDEKILELLTHQNQFEKGFRLLMQKYQERLYWHIRRMVAEHDDANDVIQNTFIKVYRNIERFKGDAKLYTWLYRIATNETITFLRKQKKVYTSSIENEHLGLANTLKADSFFDAEKAQTKLQTALSNLPEKQRLVFNMRYYDEMSYQEISSVLETSVGALKANYHHAVKKIESYLRNEDIF